LSIGVVLVGTAALGLVMAVGLVLIFPWAYEKFMLSLLAISFEIF